MAALGWGVQRPWVRREEVNHRTLGTHIGELILGYLGLRGLGFTHQCALDPSCIQSLYLRDSGGLQNARSQSENDRKTTLSLEVSDREALGGTYSPALSGKEPLVTRYYN